jgi:chromosome condensin MukBEF complex kleisin-like MukF subunit
MSGGDWVQPVVLAVLGALISFILGMLGYYVRQFNNLFKSRFVKFEECLDELKKAVAKLEKNVDLLFYSAQVVDSLKETVGDIREKVARLEGRLEIQLKRSVD